MTRFTRLIALPATGLALIASAAIAAEPAAQPTTVKAPGAAFERMKALAGEWKGTAGDMAVEESFKVISGGTAVMEELRFPGMPEHNMVSIYHMAGDSLMLTHYCAENNQPRMKSTGYSGSPAGAGTMKFEFLDVTNLAGPDAMHMSRASYEFKDADHFVSSWTAKAGGKDGQPMAFAMERVH